MLVHLGAQPALGEGIATGDVLNTASRLQTGAPPDGILVDEATWRATEHAIDYRPAEAVIAKGKAEPVPVWESVAPKAAAAVLRRRDPPRSPARAAGETLVSPRRPFLANQGTNSDIVQSSHHESFA